MQEGLKEQLAKCIELMQKEVAEFEAKYQERFAEEPHVGLGNRKTRCVNEAELPIITCHPSCLEKCAGTCYEINICTKPRPSCRRCEARNTVLRRIDRHANLHARYSAWVGDDAGEAESRRLGFDVTHVVWDGSGNCPYQKSLACFLVRKHEIARALRAQGIDTKTAKRQADRETEKAITVWHCRNCAEHGCGCCGSGDIRFNVVGEGDWALKAERKGDESRK